MAVLSLGFGKVVDDNDTVDHLMTPHDLLAALTEDPVEDFSDEIYPQGKGKMGEQKEKHVSMELVVTVYAKLYCLSAYHTLTHAYFRNTTVLLLTPINSGARRRTRNWRRRNSWLWQVLKIAHFVVPCST